MNRQHPGKIRLVALFALSILLLPMVTCTPVDQASRRCVHWGGRYQRYHLPDIEAVGTYCVFGDGTVCSAQQLLDLTCAPVGPVGPLSPLAYPKREFPPISSPYATPLPPLSPEEIVSKAALIFIGEVGEVEQHTEFAVYTEDGELEQNVVDAVGNPLPNIQVTDFWINVEEVIRDDGSIASGKPIVLRMIGGASPDTHNLTKATEFPYSFTGDRHLFLLTPNRDGKTYGLRYGPWSRLIIDGELLRVSNGEQEPFKLGGRDQPATLEEFVRFVETQPLPEQTTPFSPLATPDVPPISPLATPDVSISQATELYIPIGLSAMPLTATHRIGTVDRPPLPPASLEELVGRAPLILFGTVGPVVRYIDFCRTTEDGQLLDNCLAADVSGDPAPGYPLTEFLLEPHAVLRDDGSIARGEPIILRVIGRVTEELVQMSPGGEYPYSFTGDHFLFLLTPFPEDDVYGLAYGPWSRLIVDGNGLRVSNGAQSPLRFDDSEGPITWDQFVDYVRTTTPAEMNAPISPLATPVAPVSPLAVPSSAGVAMGGAGVMAYPTSLGELVDSASLIFFGEVGPVVQYLEYCGYGEDGQLLEQCTATDVYGNPAPGFPLTYFRMQVEEVIRDDGRIAREEPVILAELGHVTPELKQLSQGGPYPASYTGDRYLFLLAPSPDGETYGAAYGPWGRLIVDGDILRVSDGAQSPLQFGDGDQPITLEAFIQFVVERW